MDTKQTQSVAPNRVYEDYEPDFQWERNEATATLIVSLPGFRREQLRVQVTSTLLLKIIGEQPLSDNKWRRINKGFQIPPDCNPDSVTAKFERGRLNVTLPIVIPQNALEPKESPPKANNEISEEKPQKDEKELPKEEEEDKREGKKKNKKVKLGFDHHHEGMMKRTKTRVLDYTISLKPTFEEYKNSVGELKKPNKLMNSILVILFVVALGIYVKNAFKSFRGGSSN